MRRGEIYLADLGEINGHELAKIRPVLIVQNNFHNTCSSTTIVCPLTTRQKTERATHVTLTPEDANIKETSTIICEQVRVLDIEKLIHKIGYIKNASKLDEVEHRLQIALGIHVNMGRHFE